MSHNYKVRYLVEPWSAPRTEEVVEVMPGIQVSKSNYGYTDRLFLASIIDEGDGLDVMFLDTEDGPYPSREILELIKDRIDHYLECHCQ